jgi:hypothetical protein
MVLAFPKNFREKQWGRSMPIRSQDPVSESTPALPQVDSWAVAWTVVHGERSLEDYLTQRGVKSYLPQLSRRRVYSGRVKNWTLPLFPGYVFYDHAAIDRPGVFDSRKVADILLPDNQSDLKRELSQIALALSKDAALREARYGVAGRPVVIARGSMSGLCGELVRIGAHSRLILRIQFLRKAVEVAIDEAYVESL